MLKLQVRLNSFSPEGLTDRDRNVLSKLPIVLVDSSTLVQMVYREGTDLKRIVVDWRHLKPNMVCCICDFIRREALNYERWELAKSEIRRFLKKAAESKEGFYVEVKTPVRNVSADKRKRLIDLFSKAHRHVLIKKYSDLSGTDDCLLAIAVYLKSQGLHVPVATFDKTLHEALREFGLETCNLNIFK